MAAQFPAQVASATLVPTFLTTIGGESVLACHARDLHVFLKVGRRFSSWINDRIAVYGFVKDQDFTTASQNGEAVWRGGGHNRVEYVITLDMAKELAMVEKTDQGKLARRYFIECERRLQQQQTALPTGYQAINQVDLENLLEHLQAWREVSLRLYQPLSDLGSKDAAKLFSHAHEIKLRYGLMYRW